ncbi:gas vesicle protein GvpJ [Streptomyces hoynatensis]|uniref:Gas vesicle protein A n=1 Tax=Streptomyces hoynatensis TaxID=1141874 RepID=A0A3A9YXY7_9ACTN|nr:gas vesicle protein GvpJ [Streptomyces hoynatensis]RKN40908.1 gas vesicle structural protein GvpA [Streptomyces hoynatensis]
MTVTTTYRDDLACPPRRTGTLYDVIDIILDRGMVIDVFLRVSLVGIEIVKIDIRIVIASVDTYLRFAEACNRIDLETDTHSRTLPEFVDQATGSLGGVGGKAAKQKAKGAAKHSKEKAGEKGRQLKESVTGGGSGDEREE